MSDEVYEVLLIEDNPTDAELTIRALKARNLANRLKWLKDGAEALDFIFATGAYADRDVMNHPKLVLLDLQLPKVHGLEVLRRMKEDQRTKTIPVVILTSSKEDRDLIEGYTLGVNSYIAKPVQFDEFTAMVAELGVYWLMVNKPLSEETR